MPAATAAIPDSTVTNASTNAATFKIVGVEFPAASAENIYVVTGDGLQTVQITHNKELGVKYRDPTWSPDGKQVLFVKGNVDHTYSEVFVINADGSNERRLAITTNNATPVWAPDGQLIAFIAPSGPDGGPLKIYLIYPDGSGLRRLTQSGTLDEDTFAWSPTGEQLAYTLADLTSSSSESQLHLVDVDGTDDRQLALDESDVAGIGPVRWSPDGKWIATVVLKQDGNSSFRLVSPDGLQSVEVAGDLSFEDPGWSPDSQRIAFYVRTHNLDWDLAVLDVASQNWHVVAHDVEPFDRCWLLDGRQLLYRIYLPTNTLWMVNVERGDLEPRRITDNLAMFDCFPDAPPR